MKRQIVIFTGFNRAYFKQAGEKDGVPSCLTEDWIQKRSQIWFNYTWQSILNQTYKDWVYCLCCNPGAKAITDKYFGKIKDKRFFLVYSETSQEEKIKEIIAQGKDEIINVRIDSDDMYHPKAIEELDNSLNTYYYEWFLWQEGFGYQYHTDRLRRYRPGHGSGPFFAHRYRNVKLWLPSVIKECQHQTVVKKHGVFIMPKDRIIVGINPGNTTTRWLASCFKKVINDPQKDKILREFYLK